jgi:hypothetical protein
MGKASPWATMSQLSARPRLYHSPFGIVFAESISSHVYTVRYGTFRSTAGARAVFTEGVTQLVPKGKIRAVPLFPYSVRYSTESIDKTRGSLHLATVEHDSTNQHWTNRRDPATSRSLFAVVLTWGRGGSFWHWGCLFLCSRAFRSALVLALRK